jgi:RimJ/RimL family protein N-acetyltransferase
MWKDWLRRDIGKKESDIMATKRKPTKRKAAARPRQRRKSNAPPPDPHIKRDPIDPKDVELVRGKGSSESGGGPGGYYWHIEAAKKRAGNIFINIIECDIYGKHPSVQIHLNKDQRGKQIGRVAYRMACEESGYDKVYAHMRKSNHASRRAAEEAGFTALDDKQPQLTMLWQRTGPR